MGEVKESTVNPDNRTKEILKKVSERLDGVFKGLSTESSQQPTFVDPFNPDIRSSGYGYRDDEFRFWGSLETSFPYSPGIETAIIKDIKIPEDERSKGWGSKVVKVWEEAMIDNGIISFAATNIKDERALKFWLQNGYHIPKEQSDRKIPYAVIKTWRS